MDGSQAPRYGNDPIIFDSGLPFWPHIDPG